MLLLFLFYGLRNLRGRKVNEGYVTYPSLRSQDVKITLLRHHRISFPTTAGARDAKYPFVQPRNIIFLLVWTVLKSGGSRKESKRGRLPGLWIFRAQRRPRVRPVPFCK